MDGISRKDFLCVTRVPEAVGRKGYLSPTHRVKGYYKRHLAGGGLLIFAAELIFMSYTAAFSSW